MRPKQIRAVGLAVALVAWSFVVPRVPQRWRPLPNVALSTALVLTTRAPLGLRPPALWAGVRLGLTVAGFVAAAVAATTAVPPVRAAMSERDLPEATRGWLLLRIPFGTVWTEEAAYRGALGVTAADAFGPTGGRLLQAAAFGLSHIAGAVRPAKSGSNASATGGSVIGTVLATGAAGWVFAWLYERSGSLAAPMLAHLATNEGGAVAALAVRRIGSGQ